MKKERVTASKKMKTIAQPKTAINFGEDLPIFSAVSNVRLEKLNLSITTNVNDLLAPLIQQIRNRRDFLDRRTKGMDPRLNLNNDLSDYM